MHNDLEGTKSEGSKNGTRVCASNINLLQGQNTITPLGKLLELDKEFRHTATKVVASAAGMQHGVLPLAKTPPLVVYTPLYLASTSLLWFWVYSVTWSSGPWLRTSGESVTASA